MNLSKIVLLVLTGRASAELIQFGNQAEFNKLQTDLQQCNEKLGLNYTISATSEGYWAVYQYRKEDIHDDLLVEFINCVDPDTRYPVLFENRNNPSNPMLTNRNESISGPDHVASTEEPMTMGKEDANPNKVAKVESARLKRLAAQDYYFKENSDCGGRVVWISYALNDKCKTVNSWPASKCLLIHNKGCCESVMKVYNNRDCSGDGVTIKVRGGGTRRTYPHPFQSYRQLR